MKRSLLFLSAFSVFPRSTAKAIDLANKQGFDGIEIFLHRLALRHLRRDVEQARSLTLDVTLHQFWSREEHPSCANRVLECLGYTLPHPYAVRDHVPSEREIPIVIYADRGPEALRMRKKTFWWQTCSIFANGRYRLPYRQFLNLVRLHAPGVVFDTQHVLEYALDVPSVGYLPPNRRRLLQQLESSWNELEPSVREIHFNDCDPRLGEIGRNLFPGQGILPLADFCEMVKGSGWTGNIIPEVSPIHMIRAQRSLKRLRAVMESYWDI